MVAVTGLKDERVCWTRMQSEAGQGLASIVLRKEMERRSGDGLFFWGVGSAPSRAIPALAQTSTEIDVVFSVMKSRPKVKDVSPAKVLAWRCYVDQNGRIRELPNHVLVTSRAGSRGCHYALMCTSEDALAVSDQGPFDPSAFRNVGAGGAVGASQVTALLERCAPDSASDYRVAMRARMTGGYWVKLVDPVELTGEGRAILDEAPRDECDWNEVVSIVRRHCRPFPTAQTAQPMLFSV